VTARLTQVLAEISAEIELAKAGKNSRARTAGKAA
jgi:hypothetical protein